MAPATPRLAIAGAGWAGKVHTLAVAASGGATIAAIAASTTGGAEELADTIQAKPVGPDRLPAGADAVVIATPPSTHAELALRLLGDGHPVLIEKPLATTLADADAIVAAAEASGAAACYASNLVFSPALDLAASRARLIGPLDHLDVHIVQSTPEWGFHAESASDGGVLLDLGPHAIAVAIVLAGDDPVVAVRCRLASERADGADDVARVEMRFSSDLIAAIDVSWRADSPSWGAQVASGTSSVRVELQPLPAVDVDGEPVSLPATSVSGDERVTTLGFAAQIGGFASVLSGRGGRVCPVGFGRMILEIICASYVSAGRDGEEVALPFDGDRTATPRQLWGA